MGVVHVGTVTGSLEVNGEFIFKGKVALMKIKIERWHNRYILIVGNYFVCIASHEAVGNGHGVIPGYVIFP